MITIENIKAVLFPTEAEQGYLLTRMNKPAGSDFDTALHSLFFEANETTLQTTLAPFLRERAIEYLELSNEPFFTTFREQYKDKHKEKGLKSYILRQRRNGVFGADEEAIALATLFDVSLQITITTYNNLSYSAKKASSTNRPIFHLYNQWDTHWYIYNGYPQSTVANGNCLYNSLAQILRHHVLLERYPGLTSTDNNAAVDASHQEAASSFLAHMKVYETQDALRATFDGLPRRTNNEILEAIKRLSSKEKQDHRIALEVATNQGTLKSSACPQRDRDSNSTPPTLEQAGKRLLRTIDDMSKYGECLQSDGESVKSEILIRVAKELRLLASSAKEKDFYRNEGEEAFNTFKKDFSDLLMSEHAALKQYRPALKTIFANIFLALTGIGLVLIAGKLIYSQATEGRPLFFFQNNKTTSEEKVRAIENVMNTITTLKQ